MKLKEGDRVVRNPKRWIYTTQDCDKITGKQTTGTIDELDDGFYWVVWDSGHRNAYTDEDIIKKKSLQLELFDET